MPEFTCSSCAESFENKAKRNTHFLDCPNRTEHSIPINNNQVTIYRTTVLDQQYWKCLCGGALCKQHYAKWNTLKKHILTTKPTAWNITVSLNLYCTQSVQ